MNECRRPPAEFQHVCLWRSSMTSPHSALLSPSVEFSFPCLFKFCPIKRTRKILYSPVVFSAYRGESHITKGGKKAKDNFNMTPITNRVIIS